MQRSYSLRRLKLKHVSVVVTVSVIPWCNHHVEPHLWRAGGAPHRSPCRIRLLCGFVGVGGADAKAIEAPGTEPRGIRGERREGRLEASGTRREMDADARYDDNEENQPVNVRNFPMKSTSS